MGHCTCAPGTYLPSGVAQVRVYAFATYYWIRLGPLTEAITPVRLLFRWKAMYHKSWTFNHQPHTLNSTP